jgi:hypothetical protein
MNLSLAKITIKALIIQIIDKKNNREKDKYLLD